jgi:hypothetical protein
VPARNIQHDAVIQALRGDGWTITHDPLILNYGDRRVFVDLGAERATIAAERGDERIAVEIQSFVAVSPVHDLQDAVGQFVVYRAILAQREPNRILYLAVADSVFDTLFSEPLGQLLIADVELRIVVFDPQQQKVVRWIG